MNIESRLRRVETELRIWRVLSLSAIAILFFLAATNKPRELRIDRLVVGDEANGVVIQADKGVSSIYVGRSDKTSVFIAAGDDGSTELTASAASGDASIRSDKLGLSLDLTDLKNSSVRATTAAIDIKTPNGEVSLTPFYVKLENEEKGKIDLNMLFGPAVRVFDKSGYSSALGSVSLEDTKTGEKSTTSAASLRFFGKDSKTLWSAP